jgi:hypothetical protein
MWSWPGPSTSPGPWTCDRTGVPRSFFFPSRHVETTSCFELLQQELEREGLHVVAPHLYSPELLAPEGVLTRRKPTEREREDVAFGWALAQNPWANSTSVNASLCGRKSSSPLKPLKARMRPSVAADRLGGPGAVVVKASQADSGQTSGSACHRPWHPAIHGRSRGDVSGLRGRRMHLFRAAKNRGLCRTATASPCLVCPLPQSDLRPLDATAIPVQAPAKKNGQDFHPGHRLINSLKRLHRFFVQPKNLNHVLRCLHRKTIFWHSVLLPAAR